MKKTVFVFTVFLMLYCTYSTFAQKIEAGLVYRQTSVVFFNHNGESLASDIGTLYYVEEDDSINGIVKIRVLPFNIKKDKPLSERNQALEDAGVIKVDRKVFTNVFKPQRGVSDIVTVGAIVLPVKLRLRCGTDVPFSFENNVSISAAIKIAPFSTCGGSWFAQNFSVVFAPGLSSTTINEYNSSVIANAVSNPNSDAISSVREACYSFGTGFMFDFDKVTVSALFGWDYISYNQQTYNWIYQGKTWFSIGVGVNLFNIAESNRSFSNEP